MHHQAFLFSVLMVIAIAQLAQAEPDADVCTPGPGDAKGHKLPTLPEQYKVKVEAIIVNRNYSTTSNEIYDDIGNRGAFISEQSSFGKSRTYYDYDDDQYYIVFDNNTCITRNLTAHSFLAFGYHKEGDKAHVNSARDIFRFGETFNETYMGKTTIDDKTVDWWSSCYYDPHFNHTYTLDFYFTVDHPEIPSLPVRMEINGTGANFRSPGKHWFYHIYKFHDIKLEKQPDSDFLPPLGVVCPGRVSHKPIPKISNKFGLGVEVTMSSRHQVSYKQETYNLDSKIVAYEGVGVREGDEHHYHGWDDRRRIVHDYNTGISYNINLDRGTCRIKPIPTDATDAVSQDGEHVAMRSPASFFVLHGDDVEWVYEGNLSFRGIDTHSWITRRDNWKPLNFHGYEGLTVNSTWQYLFASNEWSSMDGPRHMNIPLALVINWKATDPFTVNVYNGTDHHSFYHYTSGTSHYYRDVSPCYTKMNESLQLAFNLEGKDTYKKYIVNNTDNFKHGAVDSVAKSIGVSVTRIANLHIVEGYHDLATVFFTLLDNPLVTGNSVNSTDPGPALSRAYKTMQLLVNSEEGSMLVVEFIYNNDIEHINAAVNTLREETSPLIEMKQIGLGTGAVAGIGIGTFIVGAVVALLVAFIVQRRMVADVPYSVQE